MKYILRTLWLIGYIPVFILMFICFSIMSFAYPLVMEMLEKNDEIEKAIAESTIPESIDTEFVNDLLLKIRKEQLGLKL